MILLTLQDITKHYGPEPVLSGVSFDIRAGERVSLVGPNGAGKTTLLKILMGREDADSGKIDLQSSTQIGFLEQQPEFAPGQTVWDEASSSLAHLEQLARHAQEVAKQLGQAEDPGRRKQLGEKFDRLQHELHHQDGYNLDHRIQKVLDGLGFASGTLRQPVAQLSGGQQNRLLLAKLLLAAPDLMLLDEPSNHLDIDATEWLEDFLRQSSQALLLVSHDRYFLDRVTTRTLELFHGTIDSYSGNYSAYIRQKQERLEVQRRTYEKQQTEIAKMQDFIRRHNVGQKHAQAEDRRKKLERIERVPPPREIVGPPMDFPSAKRTGDIVVRAEHVTKSYDAPLFSDLSFDILRGEKWGILGPNGTGKTTLLRCLLGTVPLDQGDVIHGTGVKVGYFDQLQQNLGKDVEAVEAIRPDHKEFVEQQRRDMLARFGITGDMVFQTVGSLSGGERNRVALAKLASLDATLLVLDEPTNHLDLWARQSLEKALKQYDGTVLFVSHDRFFLNQVADHLLIVQTDKFRVVEGNYETYIHLVARGLASEARASTAGPDKTNNKSAAAKNKRDEKKLENQSQRRKRKFPYRKVEDLELDIWQCESEIQQLHESLSSPDVLRSGDKVRQLKADLEQQQDALVQLYEHWEEASELN